MKKPLCRMVIIASMATLTACDGTYTSNGGYSSGTSQDYHWRQRQYSNPAPAVAAQPATPPAPSGYTSETGAPVAPAAPATPVRNVYTSSPAAIPAPAAAPTTPAAPAPMPAQPAAAPTTPATPAAAQPDSSGYSSGNTSFPVNPDDQSNSTAVPGTGYSSGQ